MRTVKIKSELVYFQLILDLIGLSNRIVGLLIVYFDSFSITFSPNWLISDITGFSHSFLMANYGLTIVKIGFSMWLKIAFLLVHFSFSSIK